MVINNIPSDNDSSAFLQNGTYYTFFYGIISFVVVLAALLLLYVACSRKYRLNWFEKNLLERANDINLGCSDIEKGKLDDAERGSCRSMSNCSLDKNFWVPLYHAKSNTSVNECCSIGESCSAHLGSKSSLVSFTKDDNNEVEPIARSDKQVVLATTKSARPRVSSMNRKLDHTKIDSTLYEVPRSPSVESSTGSVCISMFYDQAAGILTVRLVQAKDLLPRDFSGTSDPYAKIRLLPDYKNFWQTRIHKKTLNPVFDEDFVFEVPRLSIARRTLEIILYDFDAYSRHLNLGEVRLPLSDFELTEKVTVWKPLEPCSESNKKAELGELMVTLSYLPSAERLTVIVNKARNLRIVDESRLASDTFVKVSLIQDGKRIKKKRTSIQKNNVNPVFNESVTFDASKENLSNLSVEFCVYHDNKLGPDEYLGKATVGLGSTCQPEEDGNIKKSEKMFMETLHLAESNNVTSAVISTCDILSSLAMKRGDYEKAEDLLLTALNKLHGQGAPEDSTSVISFNLKLSRLYSNNGNDFLAEMGFKNCVELQRNKIQNNKDDQDALLLWATILYWYGKFLVGKNRYEEAKSCFLDSYQASYKIERLSPNQVTVILYNLGEVCRLLGEHDDATEHFLKGATLAKKSENPDLAHFYSKLGEVSINKGFYNDAKIWCDVAKKLAVKNRNVKAEIESKECLEKLNTFFVS